MLLRRMTRDLRGSLRYVELLCSSGDYEALKERVVRFDETHPAFDTSVGHREALRCGAVLLRDIIEAISGARSGDSL